MGPTSVTSRPDGFAQEGEIVLLATTSGNGPTLKRKGVRVRSFLNGQEFEKGDAMLVVKNSMLGIKIALLDGWNTPKDQPIEGGNTQT